MEGKIEACQWCRETQKPMLGICLGLQASVIEFSRNVLGLKGANSTEVDPQCEDKLVIDMPEHHPGNMGGTMRLGKRKTFLEPSVMSEYALLLFVCCSCWLCQGFVPKTIENRWCLEYRLRILVFQNYFLFYWFLNRSLTKQRKY